MKTIRTLAAIAAAALLCSCAALEKPERDFRRAALTSDPCDMPLPDDKPDVRTAFRAALVIVGDVGEYACWRPVYGRPDLVLIQFADGESVYVRPETESPKPSI